MPERAAPESKGVLLCVFQARTTAAISGNDTGPTAQQITQTQPWNVKSASEVPTHLPCRILGQLAVLEGKQSATELCWRSIMPSSPA